MLRKTSLTLWGGYAIIYTEDEERNKPQPPASNKIY